MECTPFRKDMLKNPIQVTVEGNGLDLAQARELADREAEKITADPLLLAWYNGKTGESRPQVVCCRDDKPSWLVYAESRGGTICIDINQETFVFIYRPFE